MRGDFPTDRAAAPAWLTIPASFVYGWFAAAYHRRFDRIKPYYPGAPVISVGNITVGGTGKTPTVIALAKFVRERFPHLQVPNAIAVLSRGYGRTSRELKVVEVDSDWHDTGDEPLLIKHAIPEVGVVVHADRRIASDHAVKNLNSKLLILDDGFQHRRLHRDLDLVMLNGHYPFGNGYLLPAGPLREPVRNLSRASLFIVVAMGLDLRTELEQKFSKPTVSMTRQVSLPPSLTDSSVHRVYAIAGIAQPYRFLCSLMDSRMKVTGHEFFPDHHEFESNELAKVADNAKIRGAEAVVTTEKDRIRISDWPFEVPLYTLGLDMHFRDADQLYDILTKIVPKT